MKYWMNYDSEKMKRGITFEIPNQHGNFLADILRPISLEDYDWHIGDEESYRVVKNELDEPLFQHAPKVINGSEMKKLLQNSKNYLIFADIKGFRKNSASSKIETYEEFLTSECMIVLLIADCTSTTIYCKDKALLEKLYENANGQFEQVSYILDDEDPRERLSVW